MKHPVIRPDRPTRVLLAALLALAAATSPAALASGLVLYYPFESQSTPASYTDSVGGVVATPGNISNTGVNTTLARPVPHSTSAFRVTASNTVTSISTSGALSLSPFVDTVHKSTGSGLTIAFWLRGSIQATRTLYGEGSTLDTNSCYSLGTDATGTKFRFYFRDKNATTILDQTSNNTILDTSAAYTDASSKWHHIVWTDNGGQAKLYVDGQLDSANFSYSVPAAAQLTNFNTSTIAGVKRMTFMYYPYGVGGGGLIDDFAVWDVVLPQPSITALYNGTGTPLTVATTDPSPGVALAPLHLTYRKGTTPKVDLDWTDYNTTAWTLETSRNLTDWAHVDVANYTYPAQWAYKVTEDARANDFYRLRKVGSPNIYVIGDSISTPGAWPINLAPLTGKHIFSQAIGGSTSPSMVNRMRGVELAYPLANPSTPGTIHMKWHRHIADRTQDAGRRTEWAACSKAVSEPTGIEIYQHGRYIGSAKRSLKNFTTNYASSTKTIYCPGHGLTTGERVTFISNDPAYPSDLSVTDSAGSALPWKFSSPNLPSAIVERRVYFAANVTTNTFEVKELAGDAATLDIGGNATGTPAIECGWSYDVDFTGGTWDVTWTARSKYDDWIWLLEVSANDMPTTNAVTNMTIPNNLLLLKQMIELNPRFLIVCPTSGSFIGREPGSVNWNNYYKTYMPWVKTNFPDNYIDTMALFDAQRTAKEKSLLLDPLVAEKLWLPTVASGGKPGDQTTWVVYRTATTGTRETWIGPGYIPLQLRTSFDDDIHPGNAGNLIIANAVAAKIATKGW